MVGGKLLHRLGLNVDIVVAAEARGHLTQSQHIDVLVRTQFAIEPGPEPVAEGVAEHAHGEGAVGRPPRAGWGCRSGMAGVAVAARTARGAERRPAGRR